MIELKQRKNNIALSTGQYLRGEDGGYYIPEVSQEGILSWTGTAEGMPIPEPANVKGPKGDKGEPGEKGADGNISFDELTEEQKASLKGEPGKDGKDGEPGPQGEPGKDGTVSFDELTEEQKASLKGETGPQGDSGVYVGSGEPAANFFVWIDTSGESDTLEAVEGGMY